MEFNSENQKEVLSETDSEILIAGVTLSENEARKLSDKIIKPKYISQLSPSVDTIYEGTVLAYYNDSRTGNKKKRLYIVVNIDQDIVQLASVHSSEIATFQPIPQEYRCIQDHIVATQLGESDITFAKIL